MKAIHKKPGEKPQVIDIDNTLAALQAAVGGYIETITFASAACIICDEEGRLKNKPFNCKLLGKNFVGPVLIVGVEGDNFTDLYKPEAVARMLFGDGIV